jgi:hypothetical protein
VSPTTIALMPQAETDALCKNVSAPRTHVLAVDAALGRLYKDKNLLVGGSREETESPEVRVAFPQFNLRVSLVAYATEQDLLGRTPNSDASLTEMFEQAPAANL